MCKLFSENFDFVLTLSYAHTGVRLKCLKLVCSTVIYSHIITVIVSTPIPSEPSVGLGPLPKFLAR